MCSLIRILHITDGLGAGGKERQLLELLKASDNTQFIMGVITFNRGQHYSKKVKENCSYFREIRKHPTRLEPLFHIWRCFNEFKPNIVHTWDSLSSFYSLLPSKKQKIFFLEGSIRDAGIEGGFQKHFKRFFLRNADGVLANSQAGLNAYKTKGFVSYNSIDLQRFLPKASKDTFNIIMVASFTDYKDQLTVLKATSRLLHSNEIDNAYFLGDGPYRISYINLVKQDYPELEEKIHFPGLVHNVEEYLATCDIGVLCSTIKYSEGLSNSVLEYMAAGLIPIATDLGGSAEIIEDGINGFLIKPEDDEAIVRLVQRVRNDTHLRNEMILKAKQTISDKFSVDKNIRMLSAFYIKQLEQYKNELIH